MSFDDVVILKWFTVNGTEPEENSIEVFAKKGAVTRTEFYASYQTGTNISAVFYVNSDDYELTKTTEDGTGKPKYASQLIHEGAVYDIFKDTYTVNGITELVCS